MSVVLDAVNTFFGQHHNHHHAQQSHPFSETPRAHNISDTRLRSPKSPRRADTPMSSSAQRTSSSTTTHTLQQQHQHDSTPTRTVRASSQASTQPTPAEPPEPPLAARSGPPSEQSRPQAQPRSTPQVGPADSRPRGRRKIKVKDLEHIQRFAVEDMDAFSEGGSSTDSNLSSRASGDSPQYEISEMKVEHIIEMVAGLLTKITTTNDQQHEHLHRQPPQYDGNSHFTQTTNSVLAFHGKNIPSITILSYLSRIHKYCPTSYEVFLSLLVYFDRMTERVNAAPLESLRQRQAEGHGASRSGSSDSLSSYSMQGVAVSAPQGTQQATPPPSGSMDNGSIDGVPGTPHSKARGGSPDSATSAEMGDPLNLSHFFVVDSFNIHRLVIAGVTCASKFFSDIFYTNSRYAKVGGLPLTELNHLELQFLLLNDFRLSVPVEEIEAYGTMLVEFYAREVVAQQKAAEAMHTRSLSESSTDSTATVRP